MTARSAAVTLPAPLAFRHLARAFGRFEDFDAFFSALRGALAESPAFAHTTIALSDAVVDPQARFPGGAISFPLLGDEGSLGVLRASAGERRLFGAEDLHLLAGLADFVGAVLAQARRVQDATRGRELLRLLLNQVPVGIAAYGADRRPIVVNELALRWLGTNALPFEEIEAGAESFYLRSDGKLVYGEVRKVTDVPGGAWMFVMHDLTPEQGRFLDGIQREIFRARAENGPCSVVLLEVADQRHGALRRLPALRAALRPGELAGPYDATRVGLVLAANGLTLRARLRRLHSVLSDLKNVRVGSAELGRDGRTPEDLLKVALQRYGAWELMLRPAILVHGENPAVSSALALVLGREFDVVQSGSEAQTRQLLDARHFEALIAEHEGLSDARSSGSIVRLARAMQPGIKTLYTTVEPASQVQVEPGAWVIEKPFEVATLTARVREALLSA